MHLARSTSRLVADVAVGHQHHDRAAARRSAGGSSAARIAAQHLGRAERVQLVEEASRPRDVRRRRRQRGARQRAGRASREAQHAEGVALGRSPASARMHRRAWPCSIGRPRIELEVSTTKTSSRGITSSSGTVERAGAARARSSRARRPRAGWRARDDCRRVAGDARSARRDRGPAAPPRRARRARGVAAAPHLGWRASASATSRSGMPRSASMRTSTRSGRSLAGRQHHLVACRASSPAFGCRRVRAGVRLVARAGDHRVDEAVAPVLVGQRLRCRRAARGSRRRAGCSRPTARKRFGRSCSSRRRSTPRSRACA